MSPSHIHVIGAGMAGLAAGVALCAAGRKVTLHETAPKAGGRCRSFHDDAMGRLIDNGNHLILGANPSVFAYLRVIGNSNGLQAEAPASFPFTDLRTGEKWSVKPSAGRLPWWIFRPSRRVAGSHWYNYLAPLRLALFSANATVADRIGQNSLMRERLWEPLTVAVLNTSIDEGSARLMWPVIKLALGSGEAGSRPYFANDGLGPALVDPAVEFIEENGGEIRFNDRLRALKFTNDQVSGLEFTDRSIEFHGREAVVLAVPPSGASQLVPDLEVPTETRAIVNAHFRLDRRVTLPDGANILGLVGGTAPWLFARDNIASVTVSAADALAERSADEITEILWRDVATALNLPLAPRPPCRVVKEKRATFAQTPDATKKRPRSKTKWKNLFLAGDWTATGLPATIEGAVRSGLNASIRARRYSR